MRNRVAAGRQVPESNSICVHASSLFSLPSRRASYNVRRCVRFPAFQYLYHLGHLSVQPGYAFIFPARMQVDTVSARSWILAVLGESRYHRSMPVMHVLHLFLQPSQSKTSERKPAHFPTRSTPWTTKPSLSHIAQSDRRWRGRIRAWRQFHRQCHQGFQITPRSSRGAHTAVVSSFVHQPDIASSYESHIVREFCYSIASKIRRFARPIVGRW